MRMRLAMVPAGLLLLMAAATALAGGSGGVHWFEWDACNGLYAWQTDDYVVDGFTVEVHSAGGAVVWSSPFVPANASGSYATPAPVSFEAAGALLCEHAGGGSVCAVTATEVCGTARARRRG